MFLSLLNPPNLNARTLRLTGRALLGIALTGCAAACPIAKADDTEFSSAIGFSWDGGQGVTISYIPSITINGESRVSRVQDNGLEVKGPLSLTYSLRGGFTNPRLGMELAYPTKAGPQIDTSINVPLSPYSADPVSWNAGLTVPFEQNDTTGRISFKTNGPFSAGALESAAANARIFTELDIPGGFSLDIELDFSKRDGVGVRTLGMGGKLELDGTSFNFKLAAPVEFYLNNGAAGEPPQPPPFPPIPDFPPVEFITPGTLFHTPGTGYIYLGNGDLGSNRQEFSLKSMNIVPGPLPILGVAAALSRSRVLRKRIKKTKSHEIIDAST